MRNIILIIISTIICIGIGAYFLFFLSPKNWNIAYRTTSMTGTDTYSTKKTEIERLSTQDANRANMAIRESNSDLCTTISTVGQQAECRDNISIAVAQKKGSIELCDIITSTGSAIECRDNIRSDRAISSHNKLLCDKVTDRDKKTVCQSAVDMSTYTSHTQSDSLTREFCNTLGSTYRKDCISKVDNNDEEIVSQKAINANDIRMCGKISNDSLRVSCSNTISLKLAIRTKTSGTCDDITGEKDQLYCRSQLSKIDDIGNYKSAMKNRDITLCTKIVDTRVQSDCHDKILLSTIKITKDTSLCQSLINTRLISPCQQIAQ